MRAIGVVAITGQASEPISGNPRSRNSRSGYVFHRLAGAAFACAVTAGAAFAEQATTIPPACAIRDVLAITLIEDHGDAQDISSEKLGAAGLKLLDARMACREGRAGEALAIYDSILSIGPVLARVRE